MIKRNANIDRLKLEFPLTEFDENDILHWDMLHKLSIQNIVNGLGVLPTIPPLEKHPYLQPLHVDDDITGIIIGTFPPISYLCSQYNLVNLTHHAQTFMAPQIDYFHGNRSSLWKYTPIDFELIESSPPSQRPQQIANALTAAGVIYTDIVKYTQRKLNSKNKYDASDENLASIIPNVDLLHYLFHSDSINRLYFTNACFFVQSAPLLSPRNEISLKNNDSFSLFIKTLLDEGIRVEIKDWDDKDNLWIPITESNIPAHQRNAINDLLKTKVILKLKLIKGQTVKEYEICSCASPAAITRKVHLNPCCVKFGGKNKLNGVAAAVGLLKYVLLHFFNNQLDLLADYNI